MPSPIPLCEPELNEADVEAVAQCIREGWLSSVSPHVAQFETAFEAQLKHWGAPPGLHVAATQSGTSAFWMTLHLLGFKPGDEFLCPATSFIASLNPLLYNQLQPVLVDIQPETLAPTLAAYQAARTPKTKAVLVTHLYGWAMPELHALREWCDAEGLILMEDAAEALGTRVQGQPVGTVGHIGYFSFNINKTLTTASGGILAAHDAKLISRLKHQSTQAKCYGEGELFHDALGFNLRMNALHAALGLSQLQRLESMLERKRAIARRYLEAFADSPKLAFMHEAQPHFQMVNTGVSPSYWLNTVFFESHAERRRVQAALQAAGIQARPVFMPFTELPHVQRVLPDAVVQNARALFPNAFAVWERGLNLPSSPHLSEEDQRTVIQYIPEACP